MTQGLRFMVLGELPRRERVNDEFTGKSETDNKASHTTLYDFIKENRFTGTVRATDIMNVSGKVIMSTYSATFKDSVLIGFRSSTSIIDGDKSRSVKLDDAVARRELMIKMLLKPLSSLEVVSQNVSTAFTGNGERVAREEWEAVKRLTEQVLEESELAKAKMDRKMRKMGKQ